MILPFSTCVQIVIVQVQGCQYHSCSLILQCPLWNKLLATKFYINLQQLVFMPWCGLENRGAIIIILAMCGIKHQAAIILSCGLHCDIIQLPCALFHIIMETIFEIQLSLNIYIILIDIEYDTRKYCTSQKNIARVGDECNIFFYHTK